MSKEDKCGALWLNESKSGTKYMSGSIELDGVVTKIVVFKNSYKEQDKHPDYVINKSTPREGQQQNPGRGTSDGGETMRKVFQDDTIPF